MRDVVPVAARVDIYAAPLLLAAAFGVLTALAFSVWPLARACELPAAALFRDAVARARALPRWPFMAVTAALLALLAALAVAASSNPVIAAWFVCGAAGAMLLFAAAARAVAWIARNLDGIGSMGARLALANLHRPGAPTGSVILSLGLGLTVLVTVALIEVNLSRQITRSLPERAPGYFFIDVQTDQIGEFRKIVGGAEGFRELRSTPMLRGRVTRLNGAAARPEDVHPEGRWILRGDRGVTWSRELPPDETVVAGQWWPADYGGPPLVSMSANSAAGLGLGIGDTITVNILGRNITARIASLRRVQWQTLRMNFLFIFSPGVLEGAPQTHLATIRADPVHERAIERAVADAFPNVTAIRVRDVLDTVNAFVARLGAAVRATAAVAIAAGVAGARRHRRRGAPPADVRFGDPQGARRDPRADHGRAAAGIRPSRAVHGGRRRGHRFGGGLGGGDRGHALFLPARSGSGRRDRRNLRRHHRSRWGLPESGRPCARRQLRCFATSDHGRSRRALQA